MLPFQSASPTLHMRKATLYTTKSQDGSFGVVLFAMKKEYFEVFFFREMAQIAPNYFKTTQQLLQNYPKTTRSSSNYPRVETTPKLPRNYPKQMNGLNKSCL